MRSVRRRWLGRDKVHTLGTRDEVRQGPGLVDYAARERAREKETRNNQNKGPCIVSGSRSLALSLPRSLALSLSRSLALALAFSLPIPNLCHSKGSNPALILYCSFNTVCVVRLRITYLASTRQVFTHPPGALSQSAAR